MKHAFELNDQQEAGWAYLFEQVNKQREDANQLPFASVEDFMLQSLVDTGNQQYMVNLKAQKQKQVDALLAAVAMPDELQRNAKVAEALASFPGAK